MSNPVIPIPKEQMVAFFNAHLKAWGDHTLAIGLSVPQLAAITAALNAAQADLDTVAEARLASKSATGTFYVSAATLRALGQQAIDRIRLQAESTNNPNVYALAQIPAPQPPGPTPAPEVPTEVFADPNADGTVTVKWKGTTANGQFFSVWRRVGEGGTWTHLSSIAGRGRSFIDTSVPNPFTTQGASLFYMVLAQRGTETSAQSNLGVIQYGAGPGFAAFATTTDVKLAA